MNIRENQEGSFIPPGGNNPASQSLSRIRAGRHRMEGQKPTGKEEDCGGDLSSSIHRAAKLQPQL
jgi:hypothetical protein